MLAPSGSVPVSHVPTSESTGPQLLFGPLVTAVLTCPADTEYDLV